MNQIKKGEARRVLFQIKGDYPDLFLELNLINEDKTMIKELNNVKAFYQNKEKVARNQAKYAADDMTRDFYLRTAIAMEDMANNIQGTINLETVELELEMLEKNKEQRRHSSLVM